MCQAQGLTPPTRSVLAATLSDRLCNRLHFTDEDTEAPRAEVTWAKPQSCLEQRQDSNLLSSS